MSATAILLTACQDAGSTPAEVAAPAPTTCNGGIGHAYDYEDAVPAQGYATVEEAVAGAPGFEVGEGDVLVDVDAGDEHRRVAIERGDELVAILDLVATRDGGWRATAATECAPRPERSPGPGAAASSTGGR